jgi:hypothetical protein
MARKYAWRVDAAGNGIEGVRYYWEKKEHAQAFAKAGDKTVERVLVVGNTKGVLR